MHKSYKSSLFALLAAAAFATGAHADDLGKKTFETCVACHSMKAGENGTGPALHKLIGRQAGSVEGFRFSGPMKRSGIVWNAETLSAFLRAPQESVPGNRMPYSGTTDEAALKALVAYLEAESR